jgi:hypothetical protein
MGNFRYEQWIARCGPCTEEYFDTTASLGVWSDANEKKMCLEWSSDQCGDEQEAGDQSLLGHGGSPSGG